MPTKMGLWCMVLALFVWGGCGGKAGVPNSVAAGARGSAPARASGSRMPQLTDVVRVAAPDYGALTIKTPGNGHTKTHKAGAGELASATISYSSGPLAQIRVTLLGPADLMPAFGEDQSLQRQLAAWTATLKGKTVEKALKPALFEGSMVRGYYVSATDAAPAPGQPKYLVNGVFCAGDGVFMLGALANESAGVKETLLAVAETAVWTGKPRSGAGAGAGEARPSGK